jgi:hypothetical protein
MGFFSRNQIGLAEKAARIAVKHGVVYSQKEQDFIGDPMKSAAAALELEEWVEKQRRIDRRENAR